MAKKKRMLITVSGILLFVIVSILYPIYHHVKPVRIFRTHGQFYWTSLSNPIENEKNVLWFGITGDGEFHEYIIDIFQPVDVINLRFDPISEPKARVWIDYIELHCANGRLQLFQFDDKETHLHSYARVDSVRNENGLLYFLTTGKDPILRMTNLNIQELVRVKVRMKVLFEETFLRWVFL